MIKALPRIVMLGFCFIARGSISAAILSSPGYAELQSAVQAGGYVQLDFDGTVIFPAEISVSKDVEIDGGGHSIILDARTTNRLFSVSGAHLRLHSLTLANGRAWGVAGTNDGYGGAILIRAGTLTMDRCEIRDCHAYGASGFRIPLYDIFSMYVPATRAIGGAIASFSSHLILMNCKFTGNSAEGPDSYGKPDLVKGEAGFGGAVWATNSVTDFDNCVFVQNAAISGQNAVAVDTPASAGGAVYTAGDLMFNARKSLFVSNVVYLGNGAALSLGSTSRLSSCTFDSNVSTGQTFYPSSGGRTPQNYAGAVFTTGELTASECVFFNNSMHGAAARRRDRPFDDLAAEPGLGGALVSLGRVMNLTNCTFMLNSAIGGEGLYWSGTNYSPYGRGGAVYAGSNTVITLSHSSFASNWVGQGAYPSPTSAPLGSAIYVDKNATLNIQASIVGPHSTAPAVFGAVTDLGFNLSADATPLFTEVSSANNTDPLFIYPDASAAPLLELQSRSPAIDRVPMRLSLIDARGFARPLSGSDSGAIEMEAPFAASTAATLDGAIEFRLGLFGHALKVEATTDFVSWRDAGFTETDARGEQVFRPALDEALTFYRFKAN